MYVYVKCTYVRNDSYTNGLQNLAVKGLLFFASYYNYNYDSNINNFYSTIASYNEINYFKILKVSKTSNIPNV